MNKRRILSLLMLIMILVVTTANASGLFPTMDEMLGTAMPSVGLAIGRTANEQAETDSGEQETYLDFSVEDYDSFGRYLAACGATVKEYSSEDSTMKATISVRDAEMFFSYDWANRKAIVVYPSGTRAETERETDDKGDSILPPMGGVMPSAEFAIGRKPDTQSTGQEGLIQTWTMFTDDDYVAFSTYLAETGTVLKDSNIKAGVLNAKLSLNGFFFLLIYDWNKQYADVIYPEGTTPESRRWNVSAGEGSILPEIKEFGLELPRISMALERKPSTAETLADGGLRETYNNFSDADYNTFSQYLQQTGCSLVDYHTDDNGVLVINLTNGSGELVFSYDALHHMGTAEYPVHTRVEKAWAPTPTPKPQVTAAPKQTTASNPKSICDNSTVKKLVSSCPAIGTYTKDSREFFSDYNSYFNRNSGSSVWRISIQNGVVYFADESKTVYVAMKAKGNPSEIIPVLKWEISVLEAIPTILQEAKQSGIIVYAEKRVDGGDYARFTDKNGVIDLLEPSKYDGVLEQEHSSLGLLEMINAFGELGDW